MNDPTTIIRHYSQKDLNKIRHFWTQLAQREANDDPAPRQNPIQNIGRPNYHPEEDLFIAEKEGDIVGFVDVIPELKIGRVILNTVTRAECRKTGLTERLLERAIQRAKALKAEKVHVNIGQDDATGRDLYLKLGFRLVRRFLELIMDLSKTELAKCASNANHCRLMKQGQEDKLRRVQNRAFFNAWGYSPNSMEDLRYWIGVTNTSPGDILLCFDGDRPAGYCWTVIKIDQTKNREVKKGRIHMLGVDPDYQGEGLGKQVLLAGLSLLKGKGLKDVGLTVDSRNKVSLSLYMSLGFAVKTSHLWYEKELG